MSTTLWLSFCNVIYKVSPASPFIPLQFVGPRGGRFFLGLENITALANGVVHAKGLSSFIQGHKGLSKGTAQWGAQGLMEEGLELRN